MAYSVALVIEMNLIPTFKCTAFLYGFNNNNNNKGTYCREPIVKYAGNLLLRSLLELMRAHWWLICVFVGFGSLSVMPCLTSGWLTLMLHHIVDNHHVLFCVQQNLKRRRSIYRLVMTTELISLLSAFQLMVCWEPKLNSF